VNDQVTGSQVLIKMLAAAVSPYDISEVRGLRCVQHLLWSLISACFHFVLLPTG